MSYVFYIWICPNSCQVSVISDNYCFNHRFQIWRLPNKKRQDTGKPRIGLSSMSILPTAVRHMSIPSDGGCWTKSEKKRRHVKPQPRSQKNVPVQFSDATDPPSLQMSFSTAASPRDLRSLLSYSNIVYVNSSCFNRPSMFVSESIFKGMCPFLNNCPLIILSISRVCDNSIVTFAGTWSHHVISYCTIIRIRERPYG